MEPFESNTGQPTKFSQIELECIDIVESTLDSTSDSDIEHEKREHERKLWNNFQNSALAVAQLYRDVPAVNPTLNQQHHWTSFQNASTNIALLYKECSDFQKKMIDHHTQSGYNKRNKELLSWTKMKKNYIRRDELLAFISGRPYPSGHGVSGIFKSNRNSRATSRSNTRYFPVDSVADSTRQSPNDETNLQAFREALYHANYKNPTNIFTSNNNNSSSNNNNSNRRSSRSNDEDLNEFISQEYFRHVESRKRSTNMDVNMDSPNNKRTKFC